MFVSLGNEEIELPIFLGFFFIVFLIKFAVRKIYYYLSCGMRCYFVLQNFID